MISLWYACSIVTSLCVVFISEEYIVNTFSICYPIPCRDTRVQQCMAMRIVIAPVHLTFLPNFQEGPGPTNGLPSATGLVVKEASGQVPR